VKQRDCDGLDASAFENRREGVHLRLVEWLDYRTLTIEPFFDFIAPPPRHERRRFLIERLIETRHADSTQFEYVAKSLGRHKRGLGALALQDGVGGDSRGVQHLRQVIGTRTRLRVSVWMPSMTARA